MKNIIEIINSIDTNEVHINPTEIYNEGWMIRLLVRNSIKDKIIINGIDFGKIENWTSEALISSPFIDAPKHREGYTHADMALGDFEVNYKNNGKIIVKDDANLFGIIEAKMGSDLSQGTKYAKNYNQASRNVACIAKNISDKCNSFFVVAGPEKYLLKHDIENKISFDTILKQVQDRFNEYDDIFKMEQQEQIILTKIKKSLIFTLSYESWIGKFEGENKIFLQNFYDKASYWNKL